MRFAIYVCVILSLVACSGESGVNDDVGALINASDIEVGEDAEGSANVSEADAAQPGDDSLAPEDTSAPLADALEGPESDVSDAYEDISDVDDGHTTGADALSPENDSQASEGDATGTTSEDSSAEEDVVAPQEDIAAPVDDVATQEDIVAPGDGIAPDEDVVTPLDDVATQEDVNAPIDDVTDMVEAEDAISDEGDTSNDDSNGSGPSEDANDSQSNDAQLSAMACLKTGENLFADACQSELEVDLGQLVIGDTHDVDVSVTNTGELAFTLPAPLPSSPFVSAQVFQNDEVLSLPATLEVGDTVIVRTSLSAIEAGPLSETLTIEALGPGAKSLTFVLSLEAVVSPCAQGLADCDGDPQTGCESDVMTSNVHCGACDSPCVALNGSALCVDGTCVLTCDTGWQGESCASDINECEGLPCAKHATCTNTPGGFECTCLEGFEGDGLVCTELVLGTLSLSLDVEVAVPGACVAGSVDVADAASAQHPVSLIASNGAFFSDAACTAPLESDFFGGAFFYRGDEASLTALSASALYYESDNAELLLHGEHFGADERPEATLIIYNLNDSDALGIAQYYAANREIDADHLCPVSLPRGIYATPEELLGARASVIEDCFCPLLGAAAPSPCDASTLPEITAALPITHLVMVRGLPARLTGTPWSTDFENPSFDFYFSVLLAADLPLFEAGSSGNHTLDYPYVSSIKTWAPDINPHEHGYFALSRLEAITPERTLALIDRTLSSEAHGFEGNILSESKLSMSTRNPGRTLTSSFAPLCSDYLSHEPFVFGSEESSWPYTSCRWGSTGTEAEGSASQLMPGMTDTSVPLAINVGFFNGGEPFSEPVDNNHSAFYNFTNMLRWRKHDGPCTPECQDLETAEDVEACEATSTDFFRVLNTECVGVAPGFMGQQLRSYPVGYYGFLPPGWFGPSGGAGDKTPGTIQDEGGYTDETFSDPYYLRLGQAGLGDENDDTCQLADGTVVSCPERVAVGLRRSETLSSPLSVIGERIIRLRIRYRNQGHPGASLQVQLYVNKDNVALKDSEGAVPSLALDEGHDTWQSAEWDVVVSEDTYPEIDHLSLQLNGNLSRKIHGFIDLDAVECLDLETGAALMQKEPLSFAWVRDRANLLGESAADVIDRMNGIAYWGSSSHHLTGGWSFYSYDVARLIFSARTLGEATAYSGAKAGLVYGDPLYRGYGVSLYSNDGNNLDLSMPRALWSNTPEDKLPYMSVLNGTDHALELPWRIDYCLDDDKVTCSQNQGWTTLMSGQGAVKSLPLDLERVYQAVGDTPVVIRLRTWRPGDDTQHLSAYGYIQVMGMAYMPPAECIYDLDENGSVSASDTNLARPYRTCTAEALIYDVTGDGVVNHDDWVYALSNPDDIDLELYDTNNDGVFDINDLDSIVATFSLLLCGETLEDGSFPEAYDVNQDGELNDEDIALIENAEGTTGCPCESVTCSI